MITCTLGEALYGPLFLFEHETLEYLILVGFAIIPSEKTQGWGGNRDSMYIS